MATSFPYVPDQPDGNWDVVLPGDACIAEVVVYATPFASEIPPYSGAFIRVDQTGIDGAFMWMIRGVSTGPGGSITTMDCRVLCRFDPAETVFLMSVDEQANLMWWLVATGGDFHLTHMVTWSPFTSADLTATIPPAITADRWVWLRAQIDAAHTLSIEYSLDHLNPAPTDWTVIDFAASVSIPVRPSFGDGYPWTFGIQSTGSGPSTTVVDVRRIFYQFNTDPSELSTFEVDPSLSVDTLTVHADTTNGHDYSKPVELIVTIESE